MPKISVVMPVYNSENYIAEAIESVLRQTFTDFELICIDDGSTDRSGEICDEYALQDSRIKVHHQENGGICKARNKGIEFATGDYLAFIDNDDEYLPKLLEDNYKLAVESDADIVKFGRRAIIENRGVLTLNNERMLKKASYNRKEWIADYFNLRNQGVFSPVWDGLYKLSLIKNHNIKFDERFRFGEEDTVFCFTCLKFTKRLALNDGVYFTHYIRVGHSTSSRFNQGILDKHTTSAIEEIKLLNEIGLYDIRHPLYSYTLIKNHLMPILHSMNHKKCDWSKKAKVRYLKKLRTEKAFAYKITPTGLIKILNRSFSIGVLAFLFRISFFRIIIDVSVLFYKKRVSDVYQ